MKRFIMFYGLFLSIPICVFAMNPDNQRTPKQLEAYYRNANKNYLKVDMTGWTGQGDKGNPLSQPSDKHAGMSRKSNAYKLVRLNNMSLVLDTLADIFLKSLKFLSDPKDLSSKALEDGEECFLLLLHLSWNEVVPNEWQSFRCLDNMRKAQKRQWQLRDGRYLTSSEIPTCFRNKISSSLDPITLKVGRLDENPEVLSEFKAALEVVNWTYTQIRTIYGGLSSLTPNDGNDKETWTAEIYQKVKDTSVIGWLYNPEEIDGTEEWIKGVFQKGKEHIDFIMQTIDNNFGCYFLPFTEKFVQEISCPELTDPQKKELEDIQGNIKFFKRPLSLKENFSTMKKKSKKILKWNTDDTKFPRTTTFMPEEPKEEEQSETSDLLKSIQNNFLLYINDPKATSVQKSVAIKRIEKAFVGLEKIFEAQGMDDVHKKQFEIFQTLFEAAKDPNYDKNKSNAKDNIQTLTVKLNDLMNKVDLDNTETLEAVEIEATQSLLEGLYKEFILKYGEDNEIEKKMKEIRNKLTNFNPENTVNATGLKKLRQSNPKTRCDNNEFFNLVDQNVKEQDLSENRDGNFPF